MDARTGTLVREHKGHQGPVLGASLGLDGSVVVSAGDDGVAWFSPQKKRKNLRKPVPLCVKKYELSRIHLIPILFPSDICIVLACISTVLPLVLMIDLQMLNNSYHLVCQRPEFYEQHVTWFLPHKPSQ